MSVHEHTVGKWRRRFVRDRIEGLTDEYRPGRPRTVSDDQVAAVIERTLHSKPKDATHWSIRSMASETGLSHTTIRRIWNAFGLQPHRSETFKLSTDPLFVDKVQDIVGLYLSPPNRAIVLCVDEKSQIQALDREQPVLPLDDCLYALQPTIPHLTRSSMHRCLQRHGISRLPDMRGDKPAKKKFRKYPIGYVHIDIAEVRTSQGKLRLFVAIDRTSKFVYVELHERAGKMVAAQFLRNFIARLPYRIHTILTELPRVAPLVRETIGDGIQFTNRKQDTTAFEHIFDRVCRENNIEHRLTKIAHPWTNGQVERMNRTLKEATLKRYHYETQDQLKTHLSDFVDAYNYARRLKTLKGLTPFEYICKIWTSEPERFKVNPTQPNPTQPNPTQPNPSWDYTHSVSLTKGHRERDQGADPTTNIDVTGWLFY